MSRAPYAICTIRPAVTTAAEPDAGLLWPLPGEAPDTIVLEPRDGPGVRRLVTREIVVGAADGATVLLCAHAIRAQVTITDARIAVACTKYDTGGGWIGGPIALVLNVASRVAAARRRRGKVLVGHVRYPWLCGVYARDARGPLRPGLLRLVVEGDAGRLRLDLGLPRGERATELATDVLQRAARFRVAHEEDATAAERAELVALAGLPTLRRATGDEALVGHELPLSRPPTTRSARLGARGDDGDDAAVVADQEATLVREPPGRPRLREPHRAAETEDFTVVLRRPAQEDDLDVTLRPKRDPPDGRRD